MIVEDSKDAVPVSQTPNPYAQALATFHCQVWVDPPPFVHRQFSTAEELIVREQKECAYRAATNPTAWNMYLSLGRYVVDGYIFQAIMEDITLDPLQVHCMVYYQYSYHVDRFMDLPAHLEDWTRRLSIPFLEKHKPHALTADTKVESWRKYSARLSLPHQWTEVAKKKRLKTPESSPSKTKEIIDVDHIEDPPQQKRVKKVTLPQSHASTASILGPLGTPRTIIEESSKASNSTEPPACQKQTDLDDTSAVSDGKQSVLIPNLNVPVCDGTYRVTLRWKTSININRISKQQEDLKDEIYEILDDLFDDDDGMLYKWQQEGTDQYHVISSMSASTVRQFISPSISILPSQSMIVIPFRFGFAKSTPSSWRNRASTQATLDKHKVTVSFSNCSSTSGALVIAGFILLKAPMTTHRLRYLQSLRKQLPANAPAFDILLHKRSPSDEMIPHLAVQCGSAHVHSLSELLANLLTGDRSALYIPRFVFSQMTSAEAADLFQTHDAHVKSLRWLPLSPLLTNLDKPRKEYHPDGKVVERTTREWARNIRSQDGTEYAHCDVVNGGTDQLAYLLFLPQHLDAATAALEHYRRLLYPFTQREANFRSNVGPPPVVHLSKSVIANLAFMKRLSSSKSSNPTSPNASCPTHASDASSASGSTVSSVSQATRPLTSADSLRKQLRLRTQVDTTDLEDSTQASTVTANSKVSTGRMSTSSARIRDLDAVLQKHKETSELKESKNSERVSHIERQLSRLTTLETQLGEVKTDFGLRLNIFESRLAETMKGHMESSQQNIEHLNVHFEKLMTAVATLVNNGGGGDTSLTRVASLNSASAPRTVTTPLSGSLPIDSDSIVTETEPPNDYDVTTLKTTRENMAESAEPLQSPEHKRLRSGKKRHMHESFCRQLDQELAAAQAPPHSDLGQSESFDSLDLALQEMEDISNAQQPIADMPTQPTQPDLESQYTASQESPEENDMEASTSPGLGEGP